MLGQCCPFGLGEHYYDPSALGYTSDASGNPVNNSVYSIGEAIAPAASKGGVVVTNLGEAVAPAAAKGDVMLHNLGFLNGSKSFGLLSLSSAAISAYHGYKRYDESVKYAALYGVLGALLPVVVPVYAFMEGYAEPEAPSFPMGSFNDERVLEPAPMMRRRKRRRRRRF